MRPSTLLSYSYSLFYRLNGAYLDEDAVVHRLSAVGCSDALVGDIHHGIIRLDFRRTANSLDEAMVAGLKVVRKALPLATLLEAGETTTSWPKRTPT